MTRLTFPISTRYLSIVIICLLWSCYSSIKRDDERNRQNGAAVEKDSGSRDDGDSRYTIAGSSSDATVTDRVTGLVWQLEYRNEMTFSDALDYCAELELSGRRDWRLPDDSELITIVDTNGDNSSSSFPNMSGEWFWTSTESIANDKFARFIRFDQGDTLLADKENAYAVRCVRGKSIVQ